MNKPKLFLSIIFLLTFSFTVFPQTTNWNKYSSSMAGFAVKFPSDWTVDNEEARGKIWQVSFGSPRVRDRDVLQASVVFICSKPKGTSFDNWGQCRQKDDHLSDSYKDRVVSNTTLEINGLSIRRKETEGKYEPRYSYIYAFFSTKDRDFLISSSFPRGFGLAKYIPVFDELLKTFEALPEREVTIYKNEIYNFAIAYPLTWKNCPLLESKSDNDDEILLFVPRNEICKQSGNFISISRMSEYSGDLLTGNQLKDILRKKGYTKFNSFHQNSSTAYGEKTIRNFNYSEIYFFTNYQTSYDLLNISTLTNTKNKLLQNETREIIATIQRTKQSR
ncbi:MAG: hypothetical protein ACR2MD_08350 [Aridibacter sp.]|jgi:hypothetical protein|nr:hypothetical protein [Acidobacteriota bacterium]